MSRFPRWTFWTGATIGVWLLWAFAIQGSLSSGLASLRAERKASEKRLSALQARIAQVPMLVALLDSTVVALQTEFDKYVSIDDLDHLMTELTSSARRAGVLNATAGPDLNSVFELDVKAPALNAALVRCDTLLVDIGATNEFRRIGMWLDGIESRPDFQHWVACRWSGAGEDNLVRFDGMVALLVTNDSRLHASNAGLGDGR